MARGGAQASLGGEKLLETAVSQRSLCLGEPAKQRAVNQDLWEGHHARRLRKPDSRVYVPCEIDLFVGEASRVQQPLQSRAV